MNKEKILESSRRENKNRDLAEMEVTAQAGNIAGRVGAAVCVVLTLIFRIFTKTYAYHRCIFDSGICHNFLERKGNVFHCYSGARHRLGLYLVCTVQVQ